MLGVHLTQTFIALDGQVFLRGVHQDFQGVFKAVHIVLVLAFVKLGLFTDHAFKLGGGLADGLIVLTVQEFRVDIAHHHIAVQLTGDFDKEATLAACQTLQRHFFFVQQRHQFGNRLIGALGIGNIQHAGVQHRLQHRVINDAAFLLDGIFRQHKLFGQFIQLFTFQRAAVGNDAGFIQSQTEQPLVFLVFVFQITLVLTELGFVKRRLGDVDIAALNQFGHLAVEERQQQRADVRAIHVGIGHDDDAVVTQFIGIKLFLADAGAQRGNQSGDFLAGQHFLETRFFYVENLTLQRQNGLEFTIAALFGRAAGGVTLHQIQFG